jgi:hypothetical protein
MQRFTGMMYLCYRNHRFSLLVEPVPPLLLLHKKHFMTTASFAGRVTVLVFACLLHFHLHAQETEFRIRAGSGFFHYSGTGSVSSTALNVSAKNAYLNNPIGTASGFSYDLSGIVRRITRYRLLYGVEAGFLSVQSKVGVDEIWAAAPDGGPAEGQGWYRSNYINLHPFIGYRILLGKIPFDLSFGNELAFGLKTIETAEVRQTNTGKEFSIDRERGTTFRINSLRIQLGVVLNRWGIDMGYSAGKPVDHHYTGLARDLRTDYLRIGFSYRIN